MPARQRMAAAAAAAGAVTALGLARRPRPLAQPAGPPSYLSHFSKMQDHRLDGAAQRGRQPVRHLRGPAQHRPPACRQRPDQQLQQQGERAGHRQDDRADHARAATGRCSPRSTQQAARHVPGRRGPDHGARGTARRLGRGRQHAVQERHGGYRQGRLPDRAEQQGPGQGNPQRPRHQRPLGLDGRRRTATSPTCSSPTC